MQKSWIAVGVVGVLAVVLAFLLLPSPDTGGDVPERERVQGGVDLQAPGVTGGPVVAGAKPGRTDAGDGENPEDGERVGVVGEHPGTAALARRSQPDAVAAGRASAPWGLVRRQLLAAGNPEYKGMLDETATMIASLREMRRDPESHDFDELIKQQRELAERVRGLPAHKEDPQVSGALQRLDEILADYEAEVGKK